MFRTALVNLYTRDIEAALCSYRDLLGFTEIFRTPTDGVPEHVELRLDGFTVGLGSVEAARRAHGVEAAPGSPAMVLVLWTDDVDRAFQPLVDAGVPVVRRPHDSGNNNRNALLRDPDGTLVEIVSKRRVDWLPPSDGSPPAARSPPVMSTRWAARGPITVTTAHSLR